MPQTMIPSPGNQQFKFVQSAEYASVLTTSTTLSSFAALYFTAGALDQISALTAVFDQYRIDEVELWIIPRLLGGLGNGTQEAGLLHSVIDYDDASNLTTVQQALDYTNVVVSSGSCGHYRRWKPHCAVAAYSGSFTSYINEESPWIDAASTAVQHYGVKLAIGVTDSVYTFDAVARFRMTWRNLR